MAQSNKRRSKRSGVSPQGSLASPAVAAFLLRPVLRELEIKLVICRRHHRDADEKGMQTNKDVLAQRNARHPAGPLIA
jgi:hypothetical protein